MSVSLNIRRNVVTTVAAFFVNIMLTFLGYRLVITQGGVAALGLWSALSASIYVIRLGDVGMSGAAERHIAASTPQLARSYLDTAIILNAVLFVTLALLGWTLLSWQLEWVVPGNDQATLTEARVVLPVMLVGFVALNLANVVAGALRGLHLGYKAAVLSVVAGLVQLAVTLLLVPQLGVGGLAWAQIAYALCIGSLAWAFCNREITRLSGQAMPWLPITGSRRLLRELLAFSLRAQAVNLANGLFEPAAKMLVGHTAGLSVMGLFETAWKLVALPRNAVVSGILGMTPAMTRLYASDRTEAIKLYRLALRLVTLSSGGVLAGVVALAPLASVLLLGRVDWTLVALVAIMAAGFWVNTIGAPAYALGFSAGRMGANFASAMISLAAVLMLGWLSPAVSPVFGPVAGTATSLAAGGIFILWRNRRLMEVGA